VERVTQSNTRGIVHLRKEPFKEYCVEIGLTIWCIYSKYWECARSQAHPCCASKKGKPVVRRGRKAYGPPMCIGGSRVAEQRRCTNATS
jgi:hypothetical protein